MVSIFIILTALLTNISFAQTITCNTQGHYPTRHVCSCPAGTSVQSIHWTEWNGTATIDALECVSLNAKLRSAPNDEKLFSSHQCPQGWILDKDHDQNYANHI